jgi:signal transduction histidine kinase
MDEARIEQVLNNLIGNAIKYSYPGGHVEVAVGKTAVAGSSSSSSRELFVMFQPEDFEEWAGTSLYKSTSATVSVDGLHHTSDGSLIPLD